MMQSRQFALAVPLLVLMTGGIDCPIALDDPTGKTSADGGAAPTSAVDIGGTKGALWDVTFSTSIVVTSHGPKHVKTKTISVSGVDTVGDSIINLGSFCSLANTLCPHKVLPTPLAIKQYASQPSRPIIGFNRLGPLRIAKLLEGLIGSLVATQLKVPLGTDHMSEAKSDSCALGQASNITATVSDKAGNPVTTKATLIQGTIKLAYGSDCFTLSGKSVVPTGSRVELSMPFTARRR